MLIEGIFLAHDVRPILLSVGDNANIRQLLRSQITGWWVDLHRESFCGFVQVVTSWNLACNNDFEDDGVKNVVTVIDPGNVSVVNIIHHVV